MKNIVIGVLVALLVIMPSAPAFASEPTCVLGGPTAMDTKRQLAEGESFVLTNRPLVVNLQFRPTKEHPERVGECMLPSGTKVSQKNGILQWVGACGNDEVNKNIFVIPFEAIRGAQGIQGFKGDKGDTGQRGPQGEPGQNYSSSSYQPVTPEPQRDYVSQKHGHGLIIGIVVVVAGAAVGIAFGMKGHGKSNSGNLTTGGAY